MTFKRNDGTVTKTVDLVYDFANRLTRKDVDTDGALGGAAIQTDHYLWEGDELVGITGYNSLVFAHGPAPDMVLFESAMTLHALLGDHLNTVRDVISTSGTLENHLVYNSYGELKSQTGGGAYSPFHRFTGKPFDTAVGLQYNVHRWYDPTVGRWTSEDPIGFDGGHPNLSAYAGNSPPNRTDPTGLLQAEPLPGQVVPTWRPIRVFADAEFGPFSLDGLFSPDGLHLTPDVDLPFILQNLGDLDQLPPAQGQIGFESPLGSGSISLTDNGLEMALDLDLEDLDIKLTTLGDIWDVLFTGEQGAVTVSSSGSGVNVQGLLPLGDYGGLGFSADGSGWSAQGLWQGQYGTLAGIFGSQGGAVGIRTPVNFGGWSGTGIFTIQTGSGLPPGLGWPDPILGLPVTSPDGTGVYFQIELTR